MSNPGDVTRRAAVASGMAAAALALIPRAARAADCPDPVAQANEKLVREALDEIINKGNLIAAPKYFSPEFVNHFIYPKETPDWEGVVEGFTRFRKAFPDLHMEIDLLMAQGEYVMVESTFTGTHQDTWQGIPATGRTVTFPSYHVVHVVDGKITEHRGSNDAKGIFEQLGYTLQIVPLEATPVADG